MVDTQHFCLRWNNYQSSITSAFENLRDDEDFVDVTLACDGRSLKAHRVVLSACSPYFRELLKSTPCKHPVIVLQDVAFTDLHALVEFIYHGEVNVHQRSLSSFLKTAEVLRVSGLTQQQADETHNLAQVQTSTGSGNRTPVGHHHPSYADKLVEDALFAQGVQVPASHLNSLHHSPAAHGGSTVNQLLRRAAAAAALRRERNNSNQSDELSLKRHRMSTDNNILGNNNNLDVEQHRHDSNKTPNGNNNNSININNNTNNLNNNNNNNNNNLNAHSKDISNVGGDQSCGNMTGSIATNGGSGGGGGGGSMGSNTDKESLTPSPSVRSNDDVKSEPMELVCSNVEHDNSSDSIVDEQHDMQHPVDMKGPINSPREDDMDSSIHSHTAPPFLISPGDSKLFAPPGSFNFSMAALAADPAALAGRLTTNPKYNEKPTNFYNAPPSSCSSLLPPTSMANTNPMLHSAISLNQPGEDFRCDPCNKNLSSLTRLKRHIQNVHMRPTKEPILAEDPAAPVPIGRFPQYSLGGRE
ncbi:broad complex Z4 [Culex quinquefasciatus]|uniref:Broad complex Z4 n=1 Tax=Culex quinquefasciatus TaxID=7176 RepID=B0W8G1_CULQU|nr:broad complex Z4 [Culex quinquefasciatus]|eukprot:XP_001844995.1 broad complex Z4 [Culex quinquefasciatus]